MTRSMLACGGELCAAILVERSLGVNLSSVFYMDNCAVRSQTHVMYALASDLRVSGGSVFSIQNSSWSVSSTEYYKGACVFEDVAVDGGSVLQVVSSTFRLGFAMLIANTLTVTDGSWLVHRNNEFRTAYVVHVVNENGVTFRDWSVWSILYNNFTYGSYSSFTHMTSNWSPPSDSRPTIYGMCNEARGSLVTNYQDDLNIGAPVTVLDCGACTVDAVCFAARTSSISGCECVCAAGGYGDTCLPAAVPDGLGPLPLLDAKDTEVRCVHGGSISSVDVPDPGVRGLCFVNVTFTAAIVLDLSYFDAPQQTLKITLLQCVLVGLSIRGSGARVHVSVTSSLLDSGELAFEGDFGVSSQILVAGSALVTTSSHAISFVEFTFSANLTLLLLDNNVEGNDCAVYFANAVVVDGGGIIVKGNTLITTEEDDGVESSFCVNAVAVKNGGHIDVENNTMSSVNGVVLFGDTTVSSAGLLRVADCTFVDRTESFDPALLYLTGSVALEGGAQWRVTGNSVGAASVLTIPYSGRKIQLSDNDTTVVLAHNRQVEDSYPFADLALLEGIVTPPARFVMGCNLRGDEEVSYDGVFPGEVVVFGCGTCNDDAACYMPGTESVDRSSCSCSCKDGWHGASCLPFEVPDTVLLTLPERAVDGDTSCVVNQTLTNVTLNMWKTHHCYAGVTFSGMGAALTFFLNSMPLHLPINITLTGCTFREGAVLQFVGGAEAAESSGVLIRVSQTVMRSSAVAFIRALPQHCDIAVTEVDAVQTFALRLPESVNNMWSVLLLGDVVLS
ncbi:dispersed gene family protein 1 (DGF-1), partial [Trypanosoma cruzi]